MKIISEFSVVEHPHGYGLEGPVPVRMLSALVKEIDRLLGGHTIVDFRVAGAYGYTLFICTRQGSKKAREVLGLEE